jgi:xylulokinase
MRAHEGERGGGLAPRNGRRRRQDYGHATLNTGRGTTRQRPSSRPWRHEPGMQSESHLLAIDQRHVRDEDLPHLHVRSRRGLRLRAHPIRFLPGGGAEQDPEDWWKALVSTCRKVLSAGTVPPDRIVGICISSTFSSTVAVDPEGNALGPCLTWMDSRGAPYVKRGRGRLPVHPGIRNRKTPPVDSQDGGLPFPHGQGRRSPRALLETRAARRLSQSPYVSTQQGLSQSEAHRPLRRLLRLDAPFLGDRLPGHPSDPVRQGPCRPPRHRSGKAPLRSRLPPKFSALFRRKAADEIGLDPRVRVIVGSPDHQSACIGSGAVRTSKPISTSEPRLG